jgi:hypothetical protein
MSDYRAYAPIVKDAWSTLEKNIFAAKIALEAEAIRLSQEVKEDKNAIGLLLTNFSNSCDALAYEEAKTLGKKLQSQIAERQYLHFAKPGLEW